MAGSVPRRFELAADRLRLDPALLTSPKIPWVLYHVWHRSRTFCASGSFHFGKNGLCETVDRVRKGSDAIRAGHGHDAPRDRLRPKSEQRLPGAMAWQRQLDHAGGSLFCADGDGHPVAGFLDIVPIASMLGSGLWHQLPCDRRRPPVQFGH